MNKSCNSFFKQSAPKLEQQCIQYKYCIFVGELSLEIITGSEESQGNMQKATKTL